MTHLDALHRARTYYCDLPAASWLHVTHHIDNRPNPCEVRLIDSHGSATVLIVGDTFESLFDREVRPAAPPLRPSFTTAVRRVKLPPPRLGPAAAVSSERVVLEPVSASTSSAIVPMTPAIIPVMPPVSPPPVAIVPPPRVPPMAAAVPPSAFPSARDLDVTDLGAIELEVVRILSGRSLSVGRIADNLSVAMSSEDARSLLDGLAEKGKVVAFIAEKRRTHYRLRSSAEACSINAQVLAPA